MAREIKPMITKKFHPNTHQNEQRETILEKKWHPCETKKCPNFTVQTLTNTPHSLHYTEG